MLEQLSHPCDGSFTWQRAMQKVEESCWPSVFPDFRQCRGVLSPLKSMNITSYTHCKAGPTASLHSNSLFNASQTLRGQLQSYSIWVLLQLVCGPNHGMQHTETQAHAYRAEAKHKRHILSFATAAQM